MDENKPELKAPPAEPPAFRLRHFNSAEGRILILAFGLVLLYVVGLAFGFLWAPDTAHVLLGMTATNVLFGRAAGLSLGYAVGLGHEIVVPINMLIETILVVLFYPLFVFSWGHLLGLRALRSLMRRIQRAAEANRDKVQSYGIAGLFLFVLVPFWMTGPVVACAIGFLINLRPWVNLGIVLGATYLAIGLWALLLRQLHDWATAYSHYAPMILVLTLLLLVVLVRLARRVRTKL
jgi:uncharacterized membrane protein